MPAKGKLCFERNNIMLSIGTILVVIVILLYSHYKIEKMQNNGANNGENKDNSGDNKETFLDYIMGNIPVLNGFIYRDESEKLERIYNPLRYPYKTNEYYNSAWYPNLRLPPQIIGCGGRRQACMGGTQIPIQTNYPPINISNRNIAPINIRTRGERGTPQQLGVIYKVLGSENEVYPLYGRQKYYGSNQWEYYTQMGRMGVKLPIITKNKSWNELGSNEIVTVQGSDVEYRTTIYENDDPIYLPYV